MARLMDDVVSDMSSQRKHAWYRPVIAGLIVAEVVTIMTPLLPRLVQFFLILPGLVAGSVFCEYSDSYPVTQALLANGAIGLLIGSIISIMRTFSRSEPEGETQHQRARYCRWGGRM